MTLARPRTVILTFWSANVMPVGASCGDVRRGHGEFLRHEALSVTVIFHGLAVGGS